MENQMRAKSGDKLKVSEKVSKMWWETKNEQKSDGKPQVSKKVVRNPKCAKKWWKTKSEHESGGKPNESKKW